MGVWTITYGGVERSAADWGLNAEPVLRLRTQAAAQFSFAALGGDPAGALIFPFEGAVIIRQNRVRAGGAYADDGSAYHFTFQGRMIKPKGRVGGDGQQVHLVFQDAWYDLENIPYQQLWTIPGGTAYFSRAYLFYNGATTPPSYLTVAQQVTNIITFAAAAGANIQAGTIEGNSQMLWWPIRGMKCADAIKKCLEFFPDLVAWVDGSTTPPSFNLRYRANLTDVTLPWKGIEASGRQHDSTEIEPRYDLVPSQVVLQYQSTITSGSTSGVQLSTDAWPAGSSGRALRALVAPLDLRGSSASFSKTQIVTQAIDPTDVAAFWQSHVRSLKDKDIVGTPTLVDSGINTGSTYGITVVDTASGLPINPAGYREMIRPSQWKSWTGVSVVEVTVTAYLSYTKAAKIGSSSTARNTNVIPRHLHTVKLKLCTAPLGTTNYQTQTAYNSGESAVPGLAQSIYNSLTQLHFEGTHTILEPVVSQIIGPWNVLNLSGGAAAWAAMNAQISEVEIDFFHNTTRIGIGPARHLSPQDLNNYLQMFRQRVMFDNAQQSGGTQAGAAVDQSGDVPLEDSNSAHPQSSVLETRAADATTAANTNAITHDAPNGQLVIQQFDATGAALTTVPSITLAQADITAAGVTNKAAKFQAFTICLNDGTIKTAAVLATIPA